jgi:hypothetical protein
VLQEARSEAPGQFKPTTLREEMLSARSATRRAHNQNIYHVIPVTGAAIDGRPFAEGKASSYKQIAPGVFVPFTVAGITTKGRGPQVRVGVNPHGHKYVPMLVHHTGAAVVRITVASIAAKYCVTDAQRQEPLYLVLALNNADVVADLAYSVSDKSCIGTKVPVQFIAAASKGEDLSESALEWGNSRRTEAFEAAVRKGLCRGTQVPGILNPILVAHEQKVRAHSKKLWAGQAARTWADVARDTASAQPSRVQPSRVQPSRVQPSRVQPSRAASARAAPVQDSDASSDASSDAPSSSSSPAMSSSSAASTDSDATPKKGTNKRGLNKSGKKGEDKKRPSRGQDSS